MRRPQVRAALIAISFHYIGLFIPRKYHCKQSACFSYLFPSRGSRVENRHISTCYAIRLRSLFCKTINHTREKKKKIVLRTTYRYQSATSEISILMSSSGKKNFFFHLDRFFR